MSVDKQENIGGPRHYTGRDAQPAAVEWKCPACLQPNTSLIGTPCVHCGSGGGAAHKGVDPIVRSKPDPFGPVHDFEPSDRRPAPPSTPLGTETVLVPAETQAAFVGWLTREAPAEVRKVLPAILLLAFDAGAQWRERSLAHAQEVKVLGELLTNPGPGWSGAKHTERTAEPPLVPRDEDLPRLRTLLAALSTFVDNILSQMSDAEVEAAGWLAKPAIQSWMSTLAAQLPTDDTDTDPNGTGSGEPDHADAGGTGAAAL